MGETIQANSISIKYSLQPVQRDAASEMACERFSVFRIPPNEKAKLVFTPEPLFKPRKKEKMVLVVGLSGSLKMDEDRVESPFGEFRIEDMLTVASSSSTVSMSGSCTAFDEFENINSSSAPSSASSLDESVSTSSEQQSTSLGIQLTPTALSVPSHGGARVSADQVLPQNSDIGGSGGAEVPEQRLEETLSSGESRELSQDYVLFNVMCGSAGRESEPIVEAEPGDHSMAVYVGHHPRRGFPDGAQPCFLSVPKPSTEYWEKVVF